MVLLCHSALNYNHIPKRRLLFHVLEGWDIRRSIHVRIESMGYIGGTYVIYVTSVGKMIYFIGCNGDDSEEG